MLIQTAASDIPVIKEVEAIMDPAAFSAVRFVMSAIPFLPFVFQSRDDVQTRNAGMELGFWISLGYLLEALGLLTSDAGRASFISLFTVSSNFVDHKYSSFFNTYIHISYDFTQ